MLCEETMRRNDATRRDDVVLGICEEDAPRRDDSALGDDVTRGDQGTKLCERMVRPRRMLHITRGDEAVREDDTHKEDAT